MGACQGGWLDDYQVGIAVIDTGFKRVVGAGAIVEIPFQAAARLYQLLPVSRGQDKVCSAGEAESVRRRIIQLRVLFKADIRVIADIGVSAGGRYQLWGSMIWNQ